MKPGEDCFPNSLLPILIDGHETTFFRFLFSKFIFDFGLGLAILAAPAFASNRILRAKTELRSD